MDIHVHTQFCGVIGNPVEHSLSPAIHNAAFQKLGLNFVYLAFRVDAIGDAIKGFRALGNFRGASVTIPHKVASVPFLTLSSRLHVILEPSIPSWLRAGSSQAITPMRPAPCARFVKARLPWKDRKWLCLGLEVLLARLPLHSGQRLGSIT